MEKVIKALKSRGNWTVVAIILANGLPAIRDALGPTGQGIIDVILLILAAYFKVNPSQPYHETAPAPTN